MSILSKVESIGGAILEAPGEIWNGIKRAWHLVEAVWSFLTGSYKILDAAWTWMVNGAEWIFGNVEHWAGETFGTLWNTITSTIPKAIAWVFDEAVKWAGRQLARVYNELRSWVLSIVHFLEKLAHDLVNALAGLVRKFISWATAPVRWVIKWGAWLIALITHPERLAEWIASAIIAPVVKWLIKSGASVIAWILRRMASSGSEFAHLIEQVLHDLL